jgi:HSP20 family protein
MTLIRWDPFADFGRLFNRMPAGFVNSPRLSLERSGKKLEWAPSTDISETEKEYLIRAELPAVRKEDVQVTFDDGIMTIKGERKQQSEDENERYHRTERAYGSFERSFSLPENVKVDAIRCESKDGILTVHIPKTETPKQKARQIAVRWSEA